jgi:hypothetical protein
MKSFVRSFAIATALLFCGLHAVTDNAVLAQGATGGSIGKHDKSVSGDTAPADRALYYVANTRPPDAFLALRTQPTTATGSRISTMPNGTALRVLERRGDGWWLVKVEASGQEGWALAAQGNRTWIECCVTASVAAPAAQQEPGLVGFRTPSNNIHCQFYELEAEKGQVPVKTIRCDIREISNRPAPRPRDCELEWGQAFELGTDERPGERPCYGDTVQDPRLNPLAYGQTWERGGLRCKSEPSGVTCTNARGHGFELSRSSQRVF